MSRYDIDLLFLLCPNYKYLESGQLYVWGLGGQSGRLGLGHSEHAVFAPQSVRFPNHSNLRVKNIALGATHALALCQLEI